MGKIVKGRSDSDPFHIEPFRVEPLFSGDDRYPIVLPGLGIPDQVVFPGFDHLETISLPLGLDRPFNMMGPITLSSLPPFDRERLGTAWLWLKLAAITVLIVLVETSQWIWSKARGKP